MADLVRGKGAYGRKADRAVLNQIAKGEPVAVFHEDAVSKAVTIETVQDVSPIIKANVTELNSGHDGYTPSREMRKVAEIPMIEVTRMMQQGINIFDQNDWPKVAAKLDDPDWSKFRTAPGTISRKPHREYFGASTSRG